MSMYIQFSPDGPRISETGDRDGHNKLKKSNSIAVTEHRRGVSNAPQSHGGPAGSGSSDDKLTSTKSFIQRRRLRQPVWAKTSQTQKKLLSFLKFT